MIVNTTRKRPPTFESLRAALMDTPLGAERNMYPYLADLCVHVLGHERKRVFCDKPLDSGAIPDVSVDVLLEANRICRTRWLIIEAKDEPGTFSDRAQRESIFAQKAKYIGIETEWFVMVDPAVMVIRHIVAGVPEPSASDVVIGWAATDESAFLQHCELLTFAAAQRFTELEKFRAGKTPHAIIQFDHANLNAIDSFYAVLAGAFNHIKDGCELAWREFAPEIEALQTMLDDFVKRYEECLVTYAPFHVESTRYHRDDARAYHRDCRRIRYEHARHPHLFRVVESLLPRLKSVHGTDVEEFLALETGSLAFSRILMIRFLEDHGCFGRKRYVCNGGVAAFRYMREELDACYPRLIEFACQEGGYLYRTVFGDVQLDWIYDSHSRALSDRIELALYHLSFYDFKSVREDILSGLFQQVIDPHLRKKHGQEYTPPDVARWLVRRCAALAPAGSVLDPACGLGTFLIEAFEQRIGARVRDNLIDYATAIKEVEAICGNDLNPIAASISLMQMLWRVLSISDAPPTAGLPELMISGDVDSLHITPLYSHASDWDYADKIQHAMVVGNPPYVRAERQTDWHTQDDRVFFEEVSVKSNLFTLFIYKAMRQWLMDEGVLGFVVPLGILDNDANAKLRALFSREGRWRILQIVDCEEVARHVFPDAAVNPILLIAQRAKPQAGDTITLSIAGAEVITIVDNKTSFDFEKCRSVTMPYASVFTPDGRILSRLTPERKQLLDRLSVGTATKLDSWQDIAQQYWVGLRKNTIVAAALEKPADQQDLTWESRRMLTMGAAFRREIHETPGGFRVYKGENIVACYLMEPPVREQIDATRMDDPSLWRFPDILPQHGYAFQQISLNLTACEFDPHQRLFLNTATLFFPATLYQSVPFDFLVLATPYQWLFAVSQREGVIQKQFSHIYPRTIARLPWSDALLQHAKRLATLREEYLMACARLYRAKETLLTELRRVPTQSIMEIGKRHNTLAFRFPDSKGAKKDAAWRRYTFGGDMLEFFDVNDTHVFEALSIIIPLLDLHDADKSKILNIEIPTTPQGLREWHALARRSEHGQPDKERRAALNQLDSIVTKTLGLTKKDVAFMRADLDNDPLFSRLKPAEPFSKRSARRGFLAGLDNAQRYTSPSDSASTAGRASWRAGGHGPHPPRTMSGMAYDTDDLFYSAENNNPQGANNESA